MLYFVQKINHLLLLWEASDIGRWVDAAPMLSGICRRRTNIGSTLRQGLVLVGNCLETDAVVADIAISNDATTAAPLSDASDVAVHSVVASAATAAAAAAAAATNPTHYHDYHPLFLLMLSWRHRLLPQYNTISEINRKSFHSSKWMLDQ